jgi:excinuclease ABC subunit C
MFQLDNLSNIPHKPGVYLFFGRKEEVLYIGKAKDLYKRVSQYFSANSVWKLDMLSKATRVEYLLAQTESEALYLEDNLIKRHQPPYNSLLK